MGDLEKQIDANQQVTFGWKDISHSVDTKDGRKQIIKNASGIVKQGIRLTMRFFETRWFTCDYGSIWVWQNDPVEYIVATVERPHGNRRSNDQ